MGPCPLPLHPLNLSAPHSGGDCPVVMPPNRSTRVVFYEELSFYGLFCGLRICKKCICCRGSAPDPIGELMTLPQTSQSVGEGDTSPNPPPLWRLDSHAFGTSIPRTPRGSLVPPPADLELATVLSGTIYLLLLFTILAPWLPTNLLLKHITLLTRHATDGHLSARPIHSSVTWRQRQLNELIN